MYISEAKFESRERDNQTILIKDGRDDGKQDPRLKSDKKMLSNQKTA